jgi:nucleotide-binding universal stress UspA family protein
MYGRILVPLDGSELAETGLGFAAIIPSRTLRLITVEPVSLSAAQAFGTGRVVTHRHQLAGHVIIHVPQASGHSVTGAGPRR